MNSLVAELASVTAKERAFLNQCTFNLSTSAALQVRLLSSDIKLIFGILSPKILTMWVLLLL